MICRVLIHSLILSSSKIESQCLFSEFMTETQLDNILEFTRLFHQGTTTAFLAICWFVSQKGEASEIEVARLAIGNNDAIKIQNANIGRSARTLRREGYLFKDTSSSRQGVIKLTKGTSKKGEQLARSFGFLFDSQTSVVAMTEKRLSQLITFGNLFKQAKFSALSAMCWVIQNHGVSNLVDPCKLFEGHSQTSRIPISNMARSLDAFIRHNYMLKTQYSRNRMEITLTKRGELLARAIGFNT